MTTWKIYWRCEWISWKN